MNVASLRKQLKYKLLSRDVYCRGCGCGLVVDVNIHMHEGIISRREFMGIKKSLHMHFYNEFNCILLCRECNLFSPPPKEQIWEEQYKIYGQKLVEWYDFISTLFRVPIRRFK